MNATGTTEKPIIPRPTVELGGETLPLKMGLRAFAYLDEHGYPLAKFDEGMRSWVNKRDESGKEDSENLGTVALQTAAAYTQAASTVTAAADAVYKVANVALTPASNSPFTAIGSGSGTGVGSTASLGGSQLETYTNANPGYVLSSPTGPGSGAGPSIIINNTFTGNTLASDQSLQSFANKVGSAMITSLRTTGGMKL